jgi:hypothetical protein
MLLYFAETGLLLAAVGIQAFRHSSEMRERETDSKQMARDRNTAHDSMS